MLCKWRLSRFGIKVFASRLLFSNGIEEGKPPYDLELVPRSKINISHQMLHERQILGNLVQVQMQFLTDATRKPRHPI
jgi:hypothetical protein